MRIPKPYTCTCGWSPTVHPSAFHVSPYATDKQRTFWRSTNQRLAPKQRPHRLVPGLCSSMVLSGWLEQRTVPTRLSATLVPRYLLPIFHPLSLVLHSSFFVLRPRLFRPPSPFLWSLWLATHGPPVECPLSHFLNQLTQCTHNPLTSAPPLSQTPLPHYPGKFNSDNLNLILNT
jgi:hypothetical protein